MNFREQRVLGRTGLKVSRLGIGASFGVQARAIEEAYHNYGINYFYWGSMRRGGMKKAVRNLAPTEREKMVVALQSYDRTGPLMKVFHERGLKALGIDYADVLILGWHNSFPAPRIMDAALELKREGKVKFLAMSGHHRPLFGEMAQQDEKIQPIDIFMIRYNAAHPGAEKEIFAHLPKQNRPGITCYTATRWGALLKKSQMPKGERPLTAGDCYRFVLSNQNVDLCMTGPANAKEMRHACEALDLGPLSEEEMERVRHIGGWVHDHAKMGVPDPRAMIPDFLKGA